jgi:hypothetical protein
MGNCIHTFFGDWLSAGHAFSESAIRDPAESRLYHPNFRQPGVSKALQNLVAFKIRSPSHCRRSAPNVGSPSHSRRNAKWC